MATTSSQVKRTYQTSLINDKERKDPRHGLACEYLAFWMMEKLVQPYYEQQRGGKSYLDNNGVYQIASGNCNRTEFVISDYVSRPIKNENNSSRFNQGIKGYADVLFGSEYNAKFLGEVKITPQSAEEILQQIKFYHSCIYCVHTVIALDFDCPQLARMVEGTDITVVRLGEKFEMFAKTRSNPSILEI
jgi:hypothetical protein